MGCEVIFFKGVIIHPCIRPAQINMIGEENPFFLPTNTDVTGHFWAEMMLQVTVFSTFLIFPIFPISSC